MMETELGRQGGQGEAIGRKPLAQRLWRVYMGTLPLLTRDVAREQRLPGLEHLCKETLAGMNLLLHVTGLVFSESEMELLTLVQVYQDLPMLLASPPGTTREIELPYCCPNSS